MTSLTFTNPWWLLVALLAIPVIISGVAWFAATMSRARAISAVVLRSILLALIAAMLAGASAVQTSDRIAVIAVVDVSDSVRQFAGSSIGDQPGAALAAARQWLDEVSRSESRRPDDLLGVVVFDGVSIAADMPRPRTSGANAPYDVDLDIRIAEGSNIDQALRYASALFPPDAARRIVLFSDGNQTDGDALAAAREISSTGANGSSLPIDIVPIAYQVTGEVLVESVDAPPQASSESTVDVRVVLRATQPTNGRLELLYEGQPVDINGPEPGTGMSITLASGLNPYRLPVRLTDATVHRFRPIFVPDRVADDRVSINNSADAFTITPGKGRVLVVDGVGIAQPNSRGLILSRALESSGIEVQTIAPAELPSDLLAFQAYDLIILQNVPAEDVTRPTHQLLADYASNLGGGLIMVGGPDSFGAGAWNGTALEDILPVELDLPEQLIVPSAAIAIVLDNSGSMAQTVMGGSRTKQEIANQAAALAIETLDATDLVGAIAFNSTYDIVAPMARNTDAATTAAKVRQIATGGGTNMYPAIERAFEDLQQGDAARAHVRHVILLSDGQSQGSSQWGINLATRMHQAGVTISTIAVGDDADTATLASIAEAGGGQFYNVIDPNVLPRIFIRDIRVVRKPLIRETPFTPVNTGADASLAASLPARLPELKGLVLTQPKDDPKITNSLMTPEGEPLLAHWFVGRGQVAAFTSDAHHWARDWLNWSGYSTFWTQLARTIARPPTQRTSELTTEIVDGQLLIRLDAANDQGAPLDLLTIPGTVFTPDQRRIDIRLEQIGPGAYQTRLPANDRGNYIVALFPRDGQAALPSVVGAASRAVGVEYRRLRSNVSLLRQIAEATNGNVYDLARPDQANIFIRDGIEPVRAALPLWRTLLLWSVIILLLDVATRRVAWDRLLTRELALEMREQAADAVKARSERAAFTVASLRKTVNKPEETQKRKAPKAPLQIRTAAPARRAPKDKTAAADEAKRRQTQRQQMLERLGKRSATSTDKPSDQPKPDAPAGKRVNRTDRPGTQQPTKPPTDQPTEAEPTSTTSGLLDAKRRARQRRNQNDTDTD